MRIAFLIRDLQMGGAERQLVALACGLRRIGHQVTILTYYGHVGPLSIQASASDVAVLSLGKRGRWDVIPFFYRLYRRLRGLRLDVLHGYLVTSNILVTIVGWIIPSVRVFWGVRASDMRLESFDWSFRAGFALSRWLSSCPDRIVVNSNAGLRYHVQMSYPVEKMVVIPNGIDTDYFVPDIVGGQRLRKVWGVSQSDILIGMVARLDPMKDHPTFFSAARLFANACQGAKFVCVGDGPGQYRDSLVAIVESLRLSDAVIWVGERSDLPAIYSALDLATLTSVTEGFPNVVAEAMACGTPVVVTDVGDSVAIVGDDRMVVSPKDPLALEAAWEAALATRCVSQGEMLRQRIVDNFSLESLATRMDCELRQAVVGS